MWISILSCKDVKIFQPIKVDGKTGIPKDILGKGLTVGALKQLDRETREDSSDSEDDNRFDIKTNLFIKIYFQFKDFFKLTNRLKMKLINDRAFHSPKPIDIF